MFFRFISPSVIFLVLFSSYSLRAEKEQLSEAEVREDLKNAVVRLLGNLPPDKRLRSELVVAELPIVLRTNWLLFRERLLDFGFGGEATVGSLREFFSVDRPQVSNAEMEAILEVALQLVYLRNLEDFRRDLGLPTR